MHNFWLATAGVLLILSILVFPSLPGGFFIFAIFLGVTPAITYVAVVQLVFLIVGIVALFAAFA